MLALFFIRLINRVFAYRCECCRKRALPLMRDKSGDPWLCSSCYGLSTLRGKLPREMSSGFITWVRQWPDQGADEEGDASPPPYYEYGRSRAKRDK